MTSTRRGAPATHWSPALPARLLALVTGLLVAGAPVSALAAPGLAVSPRAADDGSIGVRLLEAPTERRDDPRAQLYIVDHVPPGTEIERAFEVSNSTGSEQSVQLYVGPASIRDGEFVGADAGRTSELTRWASVSQSSVRLAPGEETQVDARILVPDDASPGERYGVIWASVTGDDGGDIQMVNRVGIRIYLSVGDGGEPASDFEIESLVPGRTDKGRPYVEASVVNTGGRAIDLQGTLRLLDGPGGLSAGPFDVETGTLAPDDEVRLPVLLDRSLPEGPWKARLVLRSGVLERTASATISFPDQGVGSAVAAQPEDSAWWQSWPFVVGLALVLLLLALLALLRRRRRREPGEDAPAQEVAATP